MHILTCICCCPPVPTSASDWPPPGLALRHSVLFHPIYQPPVDLRAPPQPVALRVEISSALQALVPSVFLPLNHPTPALLPPPPFDTFEAPPPIVKIRCFLPYLQEPLKLAHAFPRSVQERPTMATAFSIITYYRPTPVAYIDTVWLVFLCEASIRQWARHSR